MSLRGFFFLLYCYWIVCLCLQFFSAPSSALWIFKFGSLGHSPEFLKALIMPFVFCFFIHYSLNFVLQPWYFYFYLALSIGSAFCHVFLKITFYVYVCDYIYVCMLICVYPLRSHKRAPHLLEVGLQVVVSRTSMWVLGAKLFTSIRAVSTLIHLDILSSPYCVIWLIDSLLSSGSL